MRQSSDHYEMSAADAMKQAAGAPMGDEANWHLQAAQMAATLALASAVQEFNDTLKNRS